MTFDQLDFATYCIGIIADRLNMRQPKVFQMLNSSNILGGYIVPGYEILHTYGADYLADDIIGLMKEKGVIR